MIHITSLIIPSPPSSRSPSSPCSTPPPHLTLLHSSLSSHLAPLLPLISPCSSPPSHLTLLHSSLSSHLAPHPPLISPCSTHPSHLTLLDTPLSSHLARHPPLISPCSAPPSNLTLLHRSFSRRGIRKTHGHTLRVSALRPCNGVGRRSG